MTTQVHIVNSSDSNRQQHAVVTKQTRGSDVIESFALAPGEAKGFWITDQNTITVTEVFAPKPVEEGALA